MCTAFKINACELVAAKSSHFGENTWYLHLDSKN